MRLFLLAILGMAACYSPRYGDCQVTCTTSESCPAGLDCHDSYCRDGTSSQPCASVLGDAGLGKDGNTGMDVLTGPDADGDGIADSVDNCPRDQNPLQEDEDMDKLGDICDPCPPFRVFTPIGGSQQDANVDTDGDGVGDGCDPDIIPISMGGDHILHFAGFTQAPSPAIVEPTNGVWTFNGQATAMIPTNASFATIGWFAPADNVTRMVATQVKLATMNPAASTGAGLVDNTVSTSSSGVGCMEYQTTSGSQVALVNLPSQAITGQNVTFGSFVLKMRHNASSAFYSCDYGNGVFNTPNFPATVVNTPMIGIRASGVSASFDWVMVVD